MDGKKDDWKLERYEVGDYGHIRRRRRFVSPTWHTITATPRTAPTTKYQSHHDANAFFAR